jgi:hypothetical protein
MQEGQESSTGSRAVVLAAACCMHSIQGKEQVAVRPNRRVRRRSMGRAGQQSSSGWQAEMAVHVQSDSVPVNNAAGKDR